MRRDQRDSLAEHNRARSLARSAYREDQHTDVSATSVLDSTADRVKRRLEEITSRVRSDKALRDRTEEYGSSRAEHRHVARISSDFESSGSVIARAAMKSFAEFKEFFRSGDFSAVNSSSTANSSVLRELYQLFNVSRRHRYAGGGYVSGPGTSTSDSILARLSNREYVMQAAAVDKYGVRLFEELNAMRVNIPGFAAGGPVSTPSFAPQQPASESTVNIQLGARRATLRGEKEQVRRFVDMLNNIEAVR